MAQGVPWHDGDVSITQARRMRRSTWSTTGAVLPLRPACGMPSMLARPEAGDTARSRRQWGGRVTPWPLAVAALPCAGSGPGWPVAARRCGAPPCKTRTTGPRDLGADAPRTRGATPPGSVPTPVGGDGVLGGSVVEAAETGPVARGEGACAKDATALAPDSQARAVCTAGWAATRQAGRRRLPTSNVVRCCLHAILQIQKHCAGPWRHQGLDTAWQVDQAATTRQCAQRLRRVAAWPPWPRSGPVAQRGVQRCRRRTDCTPADEGPPAHRPSPAVARRRDSQDRRLDARRSGHGTTDSARLAVRAMALRWHLHPYGVRLRRDQPSRVAPCHDLNGVQSHPNWLHTLLIASSLGGLRH